MMVPSASFRLETGRQTSPAASGPSPQALGPLLPPSERPVSCTLVAVMSAAGSHTLRSLLDRCRRSSRTSQVRGSGEQWRRCTAADQGLGLRATEESGARRSALAGALRDLRNRGDNLSQAWTS